LLEPELLAAAGLPTAPDGQALTLAALQSDSWWQLLPAGLRDEWRRHAGGGYLFTPHLQQLHGPPALAEQDGGGGGAAAPAPDLAIVVLARLVFWARWRCGEPVVVRSAKVRGVRVLPPGLPCSLEVRRRSLHVLVPMCPDTQCPDTRAAAPAAPACTACLQPAVPWDPDTLDRALRSGQARNQPLPGQEQRQEPTISVLDCSNFRPVVIPQRAFFLGYSHGVLRGAGRQQEQVLYKVKDLPSTSEIKHVLRRHYAVRHVC
jgi:hypothetical protein